MVQCWLERMVEGCFSSPRELLVWFAYHQEKQYFCFRELLEAFLKAHCIEQVNLDDWPIYRLETGVQKVENQAPRWCLILDEQLGWYPSPRKTQLHPSTIIVQIAFAWERTSDGD